NVFTLTTHRPPNSTLFPYNDALPICENETALKEIIEAWLQSYTADEAVELINSVGVPSSTILNIAEISESEHIKIREMLVEIERSEEHTSELQSRFDLVCRLLLDKKK